MKSTRVLIGLLLLLAAVVSQAQITEGPETVKPGRFLLEMDALSLSVDKEPGYKYTAVGAAKTFLTTGLADNWDLQVGAQLFFSQEIETSGFTESDSGIGDVYIRTKWRFYESEETYTSIAVMPYVKIPTNTGGVGNDAVEGGLIIPFQTELAGDFQLAAMAEVELRRNDRDDGYDTYWHAAAALGRQLSKAIGLYGEATYGKSSGGAPADGLLGGGVTLALSEDVWWDLAVYKGIASGAPDWNYVLRFNWGF